MKELIKEIIIKIFHIETYYDLAHYLLQENAKLESELKDLKEYINIITTDIEEINLEDIENEIN